MPHKRARSEEQEYPDRNPQMDPTRHQANMAIRRDHGVFGLKVSVQSASHPPEYLDERIEVQPLLERVSLIAAERGVGHRLQACRGDN